MALSDWDKQHLTSDQQKAIEVYTTRYNAAYKAGDQAGMAAAHAGAERIRAGAGYTGGADGTQYAAKKNYATQSKGYDNGSLTTAQVKAIQAALGLTQDGYFGPQTQKAAISAWGTSNADAAQKAFTQQRLAANKAKTYAENVAEQVKPTTQTLHTGSGRSLDAETLKELEAEYQSLRSRAMDAIHHGRRDEAKQYEDRGQELRARIAQLRGQGVETGEKLGVGQTIDRVLNAAAYGVAAADVDAARTILEAAGAKGAAQKLSDKASSIGGQAGAFTAQAKDAKSGIEKVGVDLGINAAQMGMDAVAGIFTGGNSLIPMALRSYGGGTQEARQNGASLLRQMGYGAATSAVEVLTEKMFDGLAGIYGKGGADEVAKKVINKFTKNEAARKALNIAASAAGESFEEIVAGLVEPALQSIYNGKRIGENYSKETAAEIAYSALIGGIMGGLGGSVEAVRPLPTAEAGVATPQSPTATAPLPKGSPAVETQKSAASNETAGERKK